MYMHTYIYIYIHEVGLYIVGSYIYVHEVGLRALREALIKEMRKPFLLKYY